MDDADRAFQEGFAEGEKHAAAKIARARLAERQALAVADARSIENVGLRAALKEIQALSLKTENANLVWQRATRALEE